MKFMNAENDESAGNMKTESERVPFPIIEIDLSRRDEVTALFAEEYGREYAEEYVGNRILNEHTYENGIHLGVEDDGHLIAYATTVHRPDQPWFYYSSEIMVKAAYRRRGIGKRLLEERLDKMRQRGGTVAHFYLVCGREERESQRNILGDGGFTPIGIEPFKIPGPYRNRLPEGQAESMVVAMRQLDLSPDGSRQKTKELSPKVYLPDKYRGALRLLGFSFRDIYDRPDVAGNMYPAVVDRGTTIEKSEKGSYTVHINVSAPVALPLIEHYRAQGFLLSVFCPELGRTASDQPIPFDYIRMYKPPQNTALDFGAIHVVPKLEAFKAFQEQEYREIYQSIH